MIDAELVETYCDFLVITEADGKDVRAAWTVVEPHFAKLLDNFYHHLRTTSLADPLKSHDVERLKKLQYKYWKSLFTSHIDEGYIENSRRIALIHHRSGVPMASYIGAYCWFNERLFRIIARSGTGAGAKIHDMISAVNKYIFLDMMVASAAYADAVEPLAVD